MVVEIAMQTLKAVIRQLSQSELALHCLSLCNRCSKFANNYHKTCLKQPLSNRPKLFFKTNYGLMQIKNIAECSKGSILQYFRPSLSYHLSLSSLFCLFLCGRLRQFLPYHTLLRLCFVVISFIYTCTCDINHRWKIKILIFIVSSIMSCSGLII